MESGSKMMNQEVVKLNCFDGTNYPRWKDKMMFLLTFLKIAYVLDPNQPATEPRVDDSDEVKAARVKRGEDEVLCRGHILNTLSDRLFDLYSSIKSPLEIWNALEQKYNNEKQGTDKFLTMKYFEFSMRDESSIMDQVHEIQIYVSKLKDLKIEIPEAIQVGAIIAKLPVSWNNYRKKLLHSTEDFSVDQLLKHLRIEEETRIRDKMHQVQTGSKVNFVSEKKKNWNPNGGGNKRKFSENDSNKKKNVTCYNCGKKGHIKRDCRFRKKQKKEETPKIQVTESNVEEIVAMTMVSFFLVVAGDVEIEGDRSSVSDLGESLRWKTSLILILLKGDANLAAKSDQPKPAIKKSKEGCKDQDYVKLALQQVGGDVDDAVEFLVAEEESLDQIVSHDESYHSENNLSRNRRLLCLVILHVLPEYFILSSDIFDHVVLVYSH
ncbi:hypothetical protein BUALT_Bualt11G0065100 [Buddleja alternifolia]|uniref:CCHC-type domain-containing protein n=1 Tax=Buddleja alternifolia TaxID=168488 RepID=A0AAV6WTE7_9LAMI|nr:hypothetical protein BUALT_Bualt11G0065100 [Buddleja alternifolia]